jgi:hypothetical protein
MIKDLKGQQFSRLFVTSFAEFRKGHARWKCQCSCGQEVTVFGFCLTSGKTKSCGCLNRETAAIQGKLKLTTHGQKGTRLYRIWRGLKTRCLNPNTKDWSRYGGRGITCCEAWLTFEPFKEWAEGAGYMSNLSIDRIDNNLGYSPENCRWASIKVQARNKSRCVRLWYKDSWRLLAEVAEELGVTRSALYSRFFRSGRDPMFMNKEITCAGLYLSL